MIWFEDNKNKRFALVILTVFFMVFIFWRWLSIAPWSQPLVSTSQSNVDFSFASTTVNDFKQTWEMSQIQIKNLQDNLDRDQKQKELIKAAEDLAATKASSTATTTNQK